MARIFNFFKSIPTFFSLSLLSGILVGTSYIPFNGWALFFCYTPLWIATIKLHRDMANYKKIFLTGWITQFVLTLIGFNWIYYVATEFGHLHWSISLLALLSYAALMHIYIPLSLVISVKILRRFQIKSEIVQFLILALMLALIERAWPSIFEWNLGYVLLWIKLPLYHWADTVGFWGLSTWVLLLQAGFAYALTQYKSNRKAAITTAGANLLLIIALSLAGHVKAQGWKKTDDVVKIAIAQGNIGNAEKVLSEKKYQYHSYIRSIYTELTSKHISQNPTDIMIWPETAMPFGLDEYFLKGLEQNALMNSVQSWNIPVITGGYSIDPTKLDHLGYSTFRNAVFYLSPNLGYSDKPYFKTNLLAFGEYMPFGEKFPVLYQLLPFVGTFERGSGPVVANVTYKDKTVRMGPQICYDSLAPEFSRGLALNGAQILFNVTNDSWYGWWSEPYQHQIMTLARGIEVRRPLIRSTNTGISSVILADGTLLQNSPIDQSWTYTYDIPYKTNPKQTVYTRFGYLDWMLWVLVLLTLIFIYKNKGLHVRD